MSNHDLDQRQRSAPDDDRPLPPIPDGGLATAMPDWLRDRAAEPGAYHGDFDTDPADFITADDLPAWLRQLTPAAVPPASDQHPTPPAELPIVPAPPQPVPVTPTSEEPAPIPVATPSDAAERTAALRRRRLLFGLLAFLLLGLVIVVYLAATGAL